jgi:hypothetical protein
MLATSVPIAMDDPRFGSAREFPWSFGAVADEDDPDGANAGRQDILYLPVIERSDETGAQTLVHYCKQNNHCGEAAVDDAAKADALVPLPPCRPPGIRDDYDDQRSLSDKRLVERGPRQGFSYPPVAHHDKFLRLHVPGRRIAGHARSQ